LVYILNFERVKPISYRNRNSFQTPIMMIIMIAACPVHFVHRENAVERLACKQGARAQRCGARLHAVSLQEPNDNL
jgi:hypothetical protein